MQCKTCNGEMIQKSRARLTVVGILMIASIISPFYYAWLFVPSIILVLTGIYLLVWASLGKGGWCRNCKKISI